MAADWTAIASLATAGGTLVLAVATFASVRSANRAARTAERALEVGLRPLLFPSRLEDSVQKIRWVDDHWFRLEGGRAGAELVDGNIYLSMSVRNAGTGVAVMHSWHVDPDFAPTHTDQPSLDLFRSQSRDLYVPAGEIGFWQAAIRDAGDPLYDPLVAAIKERRNLIVDILYGDFESGQRTISRFLLSSGHEEQWLCAVARHWFLDHADPR